MSGLFYLNLFGLREGREVNETFKESSSSKRLETSEAECFGPVGTLAVRNPSQCSCAVLNFTANLKPFYKTVESCLELFFQLPLSIILTFGNQVVTICTTCFNNQ
jgi:hypothetical protein